MFFFHTAFHIVYQSPRQSISKGDSSDVWQQQPQQQQPSQSPRSPQSPTTTTSFAAASTSAAVGHATLDEYDAYR